MATVILHPHQDQPSTLPLVLLSPFPLDSTAWEDAAQLVGGDVITVDPPGFGGATDDEPSLEGYARALLAALDARGVERFVVAGNSMGGYVALALADLAPERLAGIGLFGTKASADADDARANRLAMAERAEGGAAAAELVGPMAEKLIGRSTRRQRPVVASRLDALLAAAPTAGIAWAQRAMAARPDRIDALRRLKAPGVVVHGAEDPMMPEKEQRVMADAVGLLIEVPCGHLIPLEMPDATARILGDLWAMCR
nr:alpha/beta hydrolase [Propionibacterium sp.]